MSARLPAALQAAIARFADEVAPKELAARSASLTRAYRSGAPSSVVADDRDVAAYLTTRLPATYAAMAAALDSVRSRAPGFAPTRVLDAGSGPGTASWAAADIWRQLESITMIDRHPHLLAAARTLVRESRHPSLATAQFVSADIAAPFVLPSPLEGRGPISDSGAVAGPSGGAKRRKGGVDPKRSEIAPAVEPLQHYDLVLAGYTFAELSGHARDRTLANLWGACRGVLVIVEPGTPAGFASVLACRIALLAAGARMVAPCPGAYPCPIVSPDWCHFAERLPRSRAHMRAKAASAPFEDEKFSYVAVAREGIELRPVDARIVAAPHAAKPGVRLRLCTPSGIGERVVLKRDKTAYRAVARKKWGDAL